MERSLRSTGCRLPVLVIPYDDNVFELPVGSTWWTIPDLFEWLCINGKHPGMRKYQALTMANYQLVDCDVTFLRNPEESLHNQSGFITCCGHWRNPDHTCTPFSYDFLRRRSTNWQRSVFNAGQFACDRSLYDSKSLIAQAASSEFYETCLGWVHHEQPGMNLLVAHSGVEVTNLTLPPINMESSWAGDYDGPYEHLWMDEAHRPYLIHWAGLLNEGKRPIDQLMLRHLSEGERKDFIDQQIARKRSRSALEKITSRAQTLIESWRCKA